MYRERESLSCNRSKKVVNLNVGYISTELSAKEP